MVIARTVVAGVCALMAVTLAGLGWMAHAGQEFQAIGKGHWGLSALVMLTLTAMLLLAGER